MVAPPEHAPGLVHKISPPTITGVDMFKPRPELNHKLEGTRLAYALWLEGRGLARVTEDSVAHLCLVLPLLRTFLVHDARVTRAAVVAMQAARPEVKLDIEPALEQEGLSSI
jgi:hypothetical protein